jgi:hypothetical protein
VRDRVPRCRCWFNSDRRRDFAAAAAGAGASNTAAAVAAVVVAVASVVLVVAAAAVASTAAAVALAIPVATLRIGRHQLGVGSLQTHTLAPWLFSARVSRGVYVRACVLRSE